MRQTVFLFLVLVSCGSEQVFETNKLTVEEVTYVILDSRTEFPWVTANIVIKNMGETLGRTKMRIQVYDSTARHIATKEDYVHNVKGGGQYTLFQFSFTVANRDYKNWPWTEEITFEHVPAGRNLVGG